MYFLRTYILYQLFPTRGAHTAWGVRSVFLTDIISISLVSNQGCSYRMGCEKCISYGHTFLYQLFPTRGAHTAWGVRSVFLTEIISISLVSNQGCSYRMGCEKCISYGHTFLYQLFPTRGAHTAWGVRSVFLTDIISISLVSNQGCSYRMGCEKCISYGHNFYISCFQPGVLIPHGV